MKTCISSLIFAAFLVTPAFGQSKGYNCEVLLSGPNVMKGGTYYDGSTGQIKPNTFQVNDLGACIEKAKDQIFKIGSVSWVRQEKRCSTAYNSGFGSRANSEGWRPSWDDPVDQFGMPVDQFAYPEDDDPPFIDIYVLIETINFRYAEAELLIEGKVSKAPNESRR